MPLAENEMIEGGSGVAPSKLPAGTYALELVDLVKRQMRRGEQFTDPSKGQSPDDMLTKLELHFKEQQSGDVLTKLVGFSTVEKSGLYKDVLPALNGGKPGIAPGEPISGKLLNSLIGRKCLGAIVVNAKGYAKIGSLLAIPGAVGEDLTGSPKGFAAPPLNPTAPPPEAGFNGPDPNVVDPDFDDEPAF